MRRHTGLEAVILPIVVELGYSYVGLQCFSQGKHSMIRLYIDKPEGVSLSDCERVSRQVNAVLEVEAPIKGEYALEVSSPGVDRLLFTPEQCLAHIGKEISVRLIVPMEGKRNLKGRMQKVLEDKLSIETDKGEITLLFADIEEARLVPKWGKP